MLACRRTFHVHGVEAVAMSVSASELPEPSDKGQGEFNSIEEKVHNTIETWSALKAPAREKSASVS